ncbi:hypothetical protein HID58_049868 [Brassica napus]|uniref:Uncharacterized protein n=1 Tax=Brassica napus TaxID=3708 RepID=A0ABQ8B687_BRANA|nr:hypothetical protein HID58_049868 [Brassica napus]
MPLGAGNGVSRRRWALSTTLLFFFTIVFLISCSVFCLFTRVTWMFGGRRSRQMLRRKRGLFVTLLSVVLSFRQVLFLAMSREGSLTAAKLWSSGSNPVVPLSVCRQDQAFKRYTEPRFQQTRSTSSSPGRLESHKPLRVAPLHQTDGRSRSITSSVPSYFGIISLPSYQKVMLSSPPLIIDGASCPLRRSFAGDFVSFVPRARMTASPEDLSFSYYTIIFILWENFTGGFTGIGYPSFLLLGFVVVADSLIGLSSCVAISTGSEDATETTSVVLVDEVWTSTSHYVTILQLSDFVVKAHSTHSSFVSDSLSSSVEDLSFLDYLCVVCYAYDQKGCIIPSCYCSEKV